MEDQVRLLLSSPADRLEIDGTTCTGVRVVDGTVVRARAVVSNVEPVRTLRGLGAAAALSEAANERLDQIKHNGSICKVLLAVDGQPRFSAAGSEEENLAFVRSSFQDRAVARLHRTCLRRREVRTSVGGARDLRTMPDSHRSHPRARRETHPGAYGVPLAVPL